MKQCMLVRDDKHGTRQQICWLPDEFAVEGGLVDVLWRKEWDKGWTVRSVYKQHLTWDDVRQSVVNQRDFGASIKESK